LSEYSRNPLISRVTLEMSSKEIRVQYFYAFAIYPRATVRPFLVFLTVIRASAASVLLGLGNYLQLDVLYFSEKEPTGKVLPQPLLI
jgi:hypothetical protein